MCGRFVMVSYDEVRGIVRRIEQRRSLLQLPDWPLVGPRADEGRAAQLLSRPNAYPGSRIAVFGDANALGVDPDLMPTDPLDASAPMGNAQVRCGSGNTPAAEALAYGAPMPSGTEPGAPVADGTESGASHAYAMVPGKCAAALGIGYLTWGYAVDWQRNPVFNTRIESALSGRGMWRESIEQRRCVVPTAGFFEPHAQEKVASRRTGRPVKRPYLFGRSDGTPTLLAGVFDEGRCSIVTTQPNASVAPVHNRMPLVLEPDEALTWIEGTLDDIAQLADRSREQLSVAPEDALVPSLDRSDEGFSSGQLSLF